MERGDQNPITRVDWLLQSAGIQASALAPKARRAVFNLPNGRGQQVFYSLGGTLSNDVVLDVVSPVANLDQHPMSGELALATLRAADKLKIGGFLINRSLLVVRHGSLLSTVTPDSLMAVTQALAMAADDAEAQLTGENRM